MSEQTGGRFLGQPWDLWRRAAIVPVWLGALFVAANAVATYVGAGQLGMDAIAYWSAARAPEMYAAGPRLDAYHYAPVFAQMLWLPAHLPWPAFLSLWMLSEAGTIAWLLRPLGLTWGGPAFLWCVPEILIGNIHGFLALSILLGVSARPALAAAWALPLLTKVTPGVGLLWHLLQRRWKSLSVAVATVAVLVAGSLFIDPEAWADWWNIVTRPGHGGDEPWAQRLARMVVATIVMIIASRTRRRWLLAVATLLSLPVWDGNAVLAVLTAIPRLAILDRDPGPEAHRKALEWA